MRIFTLKIADTGFDITAQRDDDIVVQVNRSASRAGLPHDLFHYAVEGQLRLSHGFWECVGQGALFDGMRVLSAVDEAAEVERSDRLRKDLQTKIDDAEFLVSALSVVLEGGYENSLEEAKAEIKRWWPNLESPALEGIDIPAVKASVMRITAAWDELPAGDRLIADWPV